MRVRNCGWSTEGFPFKTPGFTSYFLDLGFKICPLLLFFYEFVGSEETISTTCHFNKRFITFIPSNIVLCVLAEDRVSFEI